MSWSGIKKKYDNVYNKQEKQLQFLKQFSHKRLVLNDSGFSFFSKQD